MCVCVCEHVCVYVHAWWFSQIGPKGMGWGWWLSGRVVGVSGGRHFQNNFHLTRVEFVH